MNVRINLNESKIQNKVTNDRFGLFVSKEWKRLIDPYTPRDTSMLMQKVKIMPFKLHYKAPYAAVVYINSRGARFITQGTGRNPFATDHWDVKAGKAGQKAKLYRTINTARKTGQF